MRTALQILQTKQRLLKRSPTCFKSTDLILSSQKFVSLICKMSDFYDPRPLDPPEYWDTAFIDDDGEEVIFSRQQQIQNTRDDDYDDDF